MNRTGINSPQQITFNSPWTNRVFKWARSEKPCPKTDLSILRYSQCNDLLSVLGLGCCKGRKTGAQGAQNHRMIMVGRDPWRSPSPTLLPEQVHLEQAAWTEHWRSVGKIVVFSSTCIHTGVRRSGDISPSLEVMLPWLFPWVHGWSNGSNQRHCDHISIQLYTFAACPGCSKEWNLPSPQTMVPSDQSVLSSNG